MSEETIVSNGVHSLIRLSGTIEGQGAGQTSSHADGNLWTSSAVQIRDHDGRLTELRNVFSGDYLQQYLSPGRRATWYFRRMTVGPKSTHILVAAKDDDLRSFEEKSLLPSSYPRSLKEDVILTLFWGVLCIPTLFLLAPVALYFLLQTVITISYRGHVPPRKEIAHQVKRRLIGEGFAVPS